MTINKAPHQEIPPHPLSVRGSDLEYTKDEVNDLAWILSCSSLIDINQGECGEKHKHLAFHNIIFASDSLAINRWLKNLDNTHTQNLPKRTNYTRLGLYFEALLLFILSSTEALNGNYRILDHHLPVRHNGKTLGELDFIIENHKREKIHLEATVKYFLQHSSGSTTQWLGPNANDRFDKKFFRTFEHQLPLSYTPEFRNQYPHHMDINGHYYIFTGELFHHWNDTAQTPPSGNILCARGHWLYASEFLSLLALKHYHWRHLPKLNWLAGNTQSQQQENSQFQTKEDLDSFFNGEARYKLQLRATCFERFLSNKPLQPIGRTIVVPDYWPTTSSPARSK